MKTRFVLFASLFFFCPYFYFGQTIDLTIDKATVFTYRGDIMAAGFRSNAMLCLYKLREGRIIDSVQLSTGISNADDQLRLDHDTLYGMLTLHLRKKDQQQARLIRLDRALKVVADIDHVEPARINNYAMLGPQPYYTGTTVYRLYFRQDSTGRQYFLNKYKLKDAMANYDYQQQWQFAFERKNVCCATIMGSDSRFVYVAAIIAGSEKEGSWLLRIEQATGQLNKAVKISKNNSSVVYMPGRMIADTNNKQLILAGQAMRKNDVDLLANRYQPQSAPTISLYVISIDSFFAVENRQEVRIGVKDQKITGFVPGGYLLPVIEMKGSPRQFELEIDLYPWINAQKSFRYAGTVRAEFSLTEDGYRSSVANIGSDPVIAGMSQSPGAAQSGKLTSITDPDFFRGSGLPDLKQFFDGNVTNHQYLVRQNNSTAKTTVLFTRIAPNQKNVIEAEKPDVIPVQQDPQTAVTRHTACIGWQSAPGVFRIKFIPAITINQ